MPLHGTLPLPVEGLRGWTAQWRQRSNKYLTEVKTNGAHETCHRQVYVLRHSNAAKTATVFYGAEDLRTSVKAQGSQMATTPGILFQCAVPLCNSSVHCPLFRSQRNCLRNRPTDQCLSAKLCKKFCPLLTSWASSPCFYIFCSPLVNCWPFETSFSISQTLITRFASLLMLCIGTLTPFVPYSHILWHSSYFCIYLSIYNNCIRCNVYILFSLS